MERREAELREDLRALLITPDRGDLAAACASVAAAVRGGLRAVQVREAALSARELLAWGEALRRAAGRAELLLLVNGRVDVAADELYDGVHLGWRSLAPCAARELLGPRKRIGLSIHTLDEAADRARLEPCDYALFGPVFATPSKAGLLAARGAEGLREAARRCPRPLLAVGGIDTSTLPALRGAGHAGAAAIRGFEDPARAGAFARALAETCS
jgi:thiamine-phosphate pyrophosphorylase